MIGHGRAIVTHEDRWPSLRVQRGTDLGFYSVPRGLPSTSETGQAEYESTEMNYPALG